MRKKILSIHLLISLLFNVLELKKCVFKNIIAEPIKMNTKELNFSESLENFKITREFTITGWTQVFNMSNFTSQSKILLLSLKNDNRRIFFEDNFNNNFANCPMKEDFILNNNKMVEKLNMFQENPNCRIPLDYQKFDKKTENEETFFEIFLKKTENKVYLQFEIFGDFSEEKNVIGKKVLYFDDFEVDIKNWIFFAFSINYEENIAKIFLKKFSQNKQFFQTEKSFDFFAVSKELRKYFLIKISENNGNESQDDFGYIYNLNFFYVFFPNLSLFQNFNFTHQMALNKNKKLSILFTKYKDIYYEEVNKNTKIEIEGKIEKDLKKGIFISKNKLMIKTDENFISNSIVTSPTFFVVLKPLIINHPENIFFSAINKKKILIQLSFYKLEDDKTLGIKIIFHKNEINSIFFSKKFLTLGKEKNFSFSIVALFNKFLKVVLFYDNHYEESELIETDFLNLKDFEFSFFSLENKLFSLELFSLKIFESILPFIFSLQKNKSISLCDPKCSLLDVFDKNENNCIYCKNSVKNEISNKCENFCPVNSKNIGGVCYECESKLCNDIKKNEIFITRFDNNHFLLKLSKSINGLHQETVNDFFGVELNKFQRYSDFDYILNVITPNEIILIINNYITIFDTDLIVFLKNSAFETAEMDSSSEKISYPRKLIPKNESLLEDEKKGLSLENAKKIYYNNNYEIIPSLKAVYKILSINKLKKGEKMIIKCIGYAITTLFCSIIIIGSMMIILSFKYNLKSMSLKKILFLFQDIQMMPFLLLLKIGYPSNLNYFFTFIFNYIIGFNGILGQFNNMDFDGEFLEKENNYYFFGRQTSTLFLQNFGLIFVFQSIFVILYFFVLIAQFFFKYLSPLLKYFHQKVKNILEFDFLILIFLSFNSQIFIFCFLNFSFPSLSSNYSYLSLAVAIIYISIIILFLVFFLIISFFKKSFLDHTELKSKLSFFFIGLKNSKISNYFEWIRIIRQILLSLFLVMFNNDYGLQISGIFAISSIFLGITIIIEPLENKFELKLEIINQVAFIAILILINLFLLFNEKLIAGSIFLGWLVILLFFFKILLFYFVSLFQIFKFLQNIKISDHSFFLYQKCQQSNFKNFDLFGREINTYFHNQSIEEDERECFYKKNIIETDNQFFNNLKKNQNEIDVISQKNDELKILKNIKNEKLINSNPDYLEIKEEVKNNNNDHVICKIEKESFNNNFD